MKKKALFTIIGWVISITIIVSLFIHMNMRTVWERLKDAEWSWLILAAFINLIVIAVKSLRWQLIMQPGMNGQFEKLSSYWTIFKTTMIGLAGNNVLPARGGDWLKIYMLGKWADMSKASLASVTALDKIFDGMAILALFSIFSLQAFILDGSTQTFPAWVEKGTITVSIVIAVSLLICFLLLFHYRRSHHNENSGWLSRLIKNLGAGMDMLSKKHLIAGSILVSFISTFFQIVTLWCCQMAFGVHFDLFVPAIVFIAINLAIVIPSAPSGVGPFEAAAVLAFASLGLKTETALGIALMYHAVQFFPVTLIGFLFYFGKTRSHRKERSDPACLTDY